MAARAGPENPQVGEVVPLYGERRLRAPDSLGDAETRIFVELVATHTVTHFRPGDLSLLCRYCECCALAETAAAELARAGVVLPDGTLSKWFTVHASTVKMKDD